MASLSRLKDGRCRIEWYDGNGTRKSVSLGKLNDRNAGRIQDKVTELVQAVRLGMPLDDSVASWLAKLDDRTHSKLAKAGLTDAREKDVKGTQAEVDQPTTLGKFLTDYLAKRTDVATSTMTFYGHTRRNLLAFFGPSKRLDAIAEGDVDDFRRFLKREPLSEVTVNRRCSLAKTWFRAAVRHRLLKENPFQDVTAGRKSNSSRQRFIERQTIDRIIDAAPDAEWRLIIALARYGGLRVPSEPFSLRWSDVFWDRNRILVTAPKTKHHEGKGTRELPIFPELVEPLREAFEQAEPGSEWVIEKNRPDSVRNKFGNWQAVNLRTRFEKIIKRAGYETWPRLWQNLRSTRETELTQEGHPLHMVTTWLGNSAAVAVKHYLQVTDADFDRAAGKTARKPALSGAESGRTGSHAKNDSNANKPVCKEKRPHAETCDRSIWAIQDSKKPLKQRGNSTFRVLWFYQWFYRELTPHEMPLCEHWLTPGRRCPMRRSTRS